MAENFSILISKRNSRCRWILDLGFPDDFAIANGQFNVTYASDDDSATGTCDRTLFYYFSGSPGFRIPHNNQHVAAVLFDPSSSIYRFGSDGTAELSLASAFSSVTHMPSVQVGIYLSSVNPPGWSDGASVGTGLSDDVNAFIVQFFRIDPALWGPERQDRVKVQKYASSYLNDYSISIFHGDEDEALRIRSDPISRVSVDDVQVWLNETQLALSVDDTLPESVEIEGVLLGRMRSRFDVSGWLDADSTPPVIKTCIAKLIASRRFRTLYATREGDMPRYAFDLEEEVWGRGRDGGVIGDILNGSIDLMDSEGNIIPALQDQTSVSSYTPPADPYFKMADTF